MDSNTKEVIFKTKATTTMAWKITVVVLLILLIFSSISTIKMKHNVTKLNDNVMFYKYKADQYLQLTAAMLPIKSNDTTFINTAVGLMNLINKSAFEFGNPIPTDTVAIRTIRYVQEDAPEVD